MAHIRTSERAFASSGIGDGTGPMARAIPWTSRVELNVSPADATIVECLALALPEELMHGSRQRFGLTRNLYLLDEYRRRALFELLRGNHAPREAAERISAASSTFDTLIEECEPFVESVDKYLTRLLVEDDAYLSDIVSRFDFSTAAASRITANLRATNDDMVEKIDRFGGSAEIFRELERVTSAYDRATAQTVADAVLDVPFVVEPLSVPGFPSKEPTEVDLEQRFWAARELLETVSRPVDADVLWNRLQTDLGVSDPKRLTTVDIPLLDTPVSTADRRRDRALDCLQYADSPISYVLTQVFGVTGACGGAVYRQASGEPNWCVNPYIEHTPVDHPRVDTYGQLWQRATVGASLVGQLTAPTHDGALSCYLCSKSPGRCAGSSCGCHETVERARSYADRFAKAWQRLSAAG